MRSVLENNGLLLIGIALIIFGILLDTYLFLKRVESAVNKRTSDKKSAMMSRRKETND